MFLKKRKCRSWWSLALFVLYIIPILLVFSKGGLADGPNSFQSPQDLFDFIGISSDIELLGNPCLFTCVVFPSQDVLSIQVVITGPNRTIHHKDMQYEINGKYFLQSSFKETGKYYFYIELITEQEGIIQSELYSFWISSTYTDKDNDGLPDSWENEYGFDDEYVGDAFLDSDNDGFSNLEEYKMSTHPLENNIIENTLYKLSAKQAYFFLSFLLFCILLLFSWYGMWRETL